MTEETLLEKALRSNAQKRSTALLTKEHVELAHAWAKDEINISQIQQATGKTGSTPYSMLARGLKKHMQDNNLL